MKKTVHKNKNITFKQFIKVIFYAIIIYILCMIICLLGNFFPIVGNQISSKITQKNIEQLHLGMRRKEVIKILGKPFDKHYVGEIEYLLYSKTYMKMSAGELEIYMSIKYDKLDGIFMEFDDVEFYYCGKKKCPRIIDEYQYDAIVPSN